MRMKAIILAKTGAPPRVVALALGYTTRQFNQWMEVGRSEDEYDRTEDGISQEADESPERYEALEMFRAVVKAEAEFALRACRAVNKSIKRGNVFAAQWWLQRRVMEFGENADRLVNAPAQHASIVITLPDNGRGK